MPEDQEPKGDTNPETSDNSPEVAQSSSPQTDKEQQETTPLAKCKEDIVKIGEIALESQEIAGRNRPNLDLVDAPKIVAAPVEDPKATHQQIQESRQGLAEVNYQIAETAIQKAKKFLESELTPEATISAGAEVMSVVVQAEKTISESDQVNVSLYRYQDRLQRTANNRRNQKFNISDDHSFDSLINIYQQEEREITNSIREKYRENPILRIKRRFGFKADFEIAGNARRQELQETIQRMAHEKDASRLENNLKHPKPNGFELENVKQLVLAKVRQATITLIENDHSYQQIKEFVELKDLFADSDQAEKTPKLTQDAYRAIFSSYLTSYIDKLIYPRLTDEEIKTRLIAELADYLSLQHSEMSHEDFIARQQQARETVFKTLEELNAEGERLNSSTIEQLMQQLGDSTPNGQMSEIQFLLQHGDEFARLQDAAREIHIMLDSAKKIEETSSTRDSELRSRQKEIANEMAVFELIISKLQNINPDLWRVFSRNPEVVKLYGQEKISDAETTLAQSLIATLHTYPDAKLKACLSIENRLVQIGSIKSMNDLLLATFTQPGESGEWPLVQGHGVPDLLQYLNNLNPDRLQEFLNDPENQAAADLVKFILENPDDFFSQMFDNPKFAAIAQRFFDDRLAKSDHKEEVFFYNRLRYTGGFIDQSPFIARALEDNESNSAREFLFRALVSNNFKYTEQIMREKYTDDDFVAKLATSVFRESNSHLPFLSETLKQIVNDQAMIERLGYGNIIILFAHTDPSPEAFNKLADICEHSEPPNLTNAAIVQSLTLIALMGTSRATEWLTKGYEGRLDDKAREIITAELRTNLRKSQSAEHAIAFLNTQFQLVKNGTSRQKWLASSIIQDIILDDRFLGDDRDKLQSVVELNLPSYIIDIANSDEPVLQLHSLKQSIESGVMNDHDFDKYMSVFENNPNLITESSTYGFANPENLANQIGITNFPDNQANRIIKALFAYSESGSNFPIPFASALYLQGRLDSENTSKLEQNEIKPDPKKKEQIIQGQEGVTQQNWLGMLTVYIQIDGAENADLKPEQVEMLKAQMANPEKIDICLEQLRSAYRDHLGKMLEGTYNIDATYLAKITKENDGAGHLRHIGAIAEITNALSALDSKHTVATTRQEVLRSLQELEEFFDKNRWGNEDRSFFYNVAADVIRAAPSLFTELCADIRTMNPGQARDFAKNIYPILQAQIILAETEKKQTWETTGRKDPRKLAAIRRNLINYRENLEQDKPYQEATGELREQFVANLKENFKERFGIKKAPDELSPEDIRSLQDFVIYRGNLHDKSPEQTAKLSLFLAITINHQWELFRRDQLTFEGEDANFPLGEYFEEGTETYAYALQYLKNRNSPEKIPLETLGIDPAQMIEFKTLLQEEETVQYLGNIQTIDDKLEGILIQLQAFADPDTFPEQARSLLPVVTEFSPRTVNSALGKKIQAELGKTIALSEEENQIIERLLHANGQSSAPLKDQLAEIQMSIKSIALTGSILQKSGEYRAEIVKLRELLKPSEKIIEIFKTLGEDFSTESGAMALSQDLSYLEAILNKNQDKLTDPEEIQAVNQYISEIREQMKTLEKAVSDIDGKLVAVLKQAQEQQEQGLADITSGIIRNVRQQETEMKILSVCTNRWVQIIENMRQCLACKTNGCNNDTNLSFGDNNKFYLFSQAGEKSTEEGSIADEIVFFAPTTIQGKHELSMDTDGRREMSFVFDRVYGNNSPDILIGHILSIAKKYSKIKAKFPQTNLSIIVTEAAMASSGISYDVLASRLPNELKLAIEPTYAEVNILESAASDHYIEFGGPVRGAGARLISGMRLSAA